MNDNSMNDSLTNPPQVRPSRIQNAAKALLLIGLGLFLYSRIASGTLAFYINERFMGYTLFAFIGLIAVGLSYQVAQRKGQATTEASATSPITSSSATIDYQYHDLAPHDHSRDHRITWIGAFIVALPILLGILVPPRPLGASALENREINLDIRAGGTNLPAAVAAVSKESGTKNLMDWWQTFQHTSDLATLAGSEVQVQGFVFQDGRYGDDHFLVARFTVSCCVADASALALVVYWPDAPALENDQWVEVRGLFSPSELEGWRPPIITAETITTIPVPSQPYLYP
jgi:putative membrane protein